MTIDMQSAGYALAPDADTERVGPNHARFDVSDELFLEWLRAPDGLTVVDIQHDANSGTFAVVVAHPDLPELTDGAIIPILTPWFTANHLECGHDEITATWPGLDDG